MLISQKKIMVFLGALLLSLLLVAQAAFAEGGENADSPGISGQKPLSFLSITVQGSGQNVQNAVDISTQPKFTIAFDKNVVNSVLWENNRKCFSLVSENHESVPVSVTKIDDSIDFTQRQNIFVQPTVPLNPGTSYTLRISPELKAKNGVSTLGGTTSGQELVISFKTAGQAVQAVGQSPVPVEAAAGQTPVNTPTVGAAITPDNPGVNDNAGGTGIQDKPLAATGQQVSNSPDAGKDGQLTAAEAKKEPANPVGTDKNFNWTNMLTILFVVLVAGWIGIEIFIKRRKK